MDPSPDGVAHHAHAPQTSVAGRSTRPAPGCTVGALTVDLALLGVAAPPAQVEALFVDLVARHGEAQRAYHTLEHVSEVLGLVDRFGQNADDLGAVRLAAWFHDAIYEAAHSPGADSNEDRSAVLAHDALTALGVDEGRADEVARLIRLTAGHEVNDDDHNGAVLHDADLGILATPPERYRRYAADVRREYAHVPDDLYRSGRAAILRGFVQRTHLFVLPDHGPEREARAHANLEAEIAELEGSIPT